MTKLFKILKKRKTIEERIRDIQEGNEEEKNSIIQEHIPFIKKILSQQLGRYIEIENDDMFSIGLMAFNEAIDKYETSRGKFLSFAAIVIKNRSIDQLRKQSRTSNEVIVSQMIGDDGEASSTDHMASVESFENRVEAKVDMGIFIKRMAEFQVTLDDLINEAPRHMDTRLNAIKIGRYVHENHQLKEKLLRRKKLPTSELMKELMVSKKVVQGSRKFIIAVILILDSNLDTMKEYISQVEGGDYIDE
ncbi:RNA polymerase, sigma 28 subunit, FliA/WhiG family [Alkaliphilus metalliredigens QYMF]|uniref:RNA polymerase sigma factor SigI n=1 Tax=Alkaliphilus metalliredigens (strain QYMF) TaxID=293826 RepID=A6TJG2_ALKMQ|nr:RNA polymerase sigma factor SigI [Alkaliphilus metalliredigens]ABR46330.1 RNA polymerase, sigma 28 subunit, FliA/WhiG family [Alkaliphilus metalliredigens QYMF]